MQDREIIQSYLNNFRRYFSMYLRPAIGMQIDVHPCTDDGAVIVITLGLISANQDRFLQVKSNVAQVLKYVPQNFVSGNIGNINFRGTNLSINKNRIVIIKDNDIAQWNAKQAKVDVSKITSPLKQTKK